MAGKNFKKLKSRVNNYVGSVPGDIDNIGDKISNFKNNFGTGKNISNFFDQRISDGLDTLIQGSLGVRASNIPEIKEDIMMARQASRSARNAAHFGDGFGLFDAIDRSVEAPEKFKLFRYPVHYGNEDMCEIFPNYMHFRSLPRRHKIGRTETQDGRFNDGSPSMSDDDTELYDIFLSLPDNLVDNLQVSYSEAEAGILDQIVGTLFNTNNGIMNNTTFDKEQIKEQFLKFMPGADVRDAAKGTMTNPLKFNKFSGVPFRTYTYQFTMRPKNEIESGILRQIVGAFKRSMLPGVQGTSSRIWTFPNEWVIEYDGLIRNWVDIPLTSVCTSCDIDYTAGAGYVPTIDGAPQAMTISLGFTETVPLHRKRFFEEVSAANPDRKSKAVEGTQITDAMIGIEEKSATEVEKDKEDTGSIELKSKPNAGDPSARKNTFDGFFGPARRGNYYGFGSKKGT